MKTKIKGFIFGILLYVLFLPVTWVRAAVTSTVIVLQERIVEPVLLPKISLKSPVEPVVEANTKVAVPQPQQIPQAQPAVVANNNDDIGYIKRRICEVFGKECSNALIIAEHESGFRNRVVSRTNDYGLFQLNCRWQGRRVGYNCSRFFDMETNLRIAKQIFDEQGWNPWTTKKFLKSY